MGYLRHSGGILKWQRVSNDITRIQAEESIKTCIEKNRVKVVRLYDENEGQNSQRRHLSGYHLKDGIMGTGSN